LICFADLSMNRNWATSARQRFGLRLSSAAVADAVQKAISY